MKASSLSWSRVVMCSSSWWVMAAPSRRSLQWRCSARTVPLQGLCKAGAEAVPTAPTTGDTMTELIARRAAADEHELLAGATARTPFTPPDGLSGVPMERVVLDGEQLVVKHLGEDLDWVARVFGDPVCRPVLMWELGLYDKVAPYVDPAVVGVSRDRTTGRCLVLMHDV